MACVYCLWKVSIACIVCLLLVEGVYCLYCVSIACGMCLSFVESVYCLWKVSTAPSGLSGNHEAMASPFLASDNIADLLASKHCREIVDAQAGALNLQAYTLIPDSIPGSPA